MSHEETTRVNSPLENALRHISLLEERVARLEVLMNGVQKLHSKEEPRFSDSESNVHEVTAYEIRKVQDQGKIESGITSELEIRDATLISILKQVIGRYPGINFDATRVIMESPFPALVHNLEKLQERAHATPESQDCKDLTSLLSCIRASPELNDYFHGRDSNLSSGMVTFDSLWTIFPPDALVVATPFMDSKQILKVIATPYTSQRSQGVFRVRAWQWDWDGRMMLKVGYDLEIEYFRGTKSFTVLPVYPLDAIETTQRHKLCDHIRKRALQFIKATIRCKPGASQAFQYSGQVYAHARGILKKPGKTKRQESEMEDDELSPTIIPVKGEFICDTLAFSQNGTGPFPLGKIWKQSQIHVERFQSTSDDCFDFQERISNLDIDRGKVEDHDDFLLLPPRLLGYATRQKLWAQFKVEWATPSSGKQPKNFNEVLQLAEHHKEAIEALVMSHDSNHASMVPDVVQDKGNGLAILLHGAPGVGKTLTAETIAEAVGKPLLLITVADIGLDLEHVERYFEKVYSLATKWQAILLIDEADILLTARSSVVDIHSLISVVLFRVLEYVQGITILTTNRVGLFDEAALSRIDLIINCGGSLTLDRRLSIFRYFYDQLEPSVRGGERHLIYEWAGEWLEENSRGINGREIRSMILSALGLAKLRGAKQIGDGMLTKRDLKAAARIRAEFSLYLLELHDGPAERVAQRKGER